MQRKPKPLQIGESLPKQLLVEGNDDFHALCQIFEANQLPNQFGIKEKNGYPKLIETLDVELDAYGLQALGIIVDADENFQARWQSLRNRLIEFQYFDTPVEPSLNGTIVYPTNPTRPIIGIWIMPNNQLPGILENFIAYLIPNRESNPSWQYAVQCVAGIPDD
ncbi:MAG: DUF3226 domain-containing protein, partial [Candidatus Methylumidiphilus sp.]